MKIVGWRAWRVEQTDEGARLASPMRGDLWPLEGLRARCSCAGQDIDSCTGECGIRIWKSRDLALAEARNAGGECVIGTARAWGRVSEYDRAWLASSCTIEHLEMQELDLREQRQLEAYLSEKPPGSSSSSSV
jgi:hypothetical protein